MMVADTQAGDAVERDEKVAGQLREWADELLANPKKRVADVRLAFEIREYAAKLNSDVRALALASRASALDEAGGWQPIETAPTDWT